MILHVAVRILCDPSSSAELISYSENLLRCFVEQACVLYGETVNVYNVHALVHLAQEVRRFGPHDTFSSFPFENYLGTLKRMLRSGNRSLAQVYKRLNERVHTRERAPRKPAFKLLREHTEGPVPRNLHSCGQHREAIYKEVSITRTAGNNCVVLKNHEVLLAENILSSVGLVYLIGRTFSVVHDLYTYPCRSTSVGVSMVSAPSRHHSLWEPREVNRKCCLFSLGSSYACFPILHTAVKD